LRPRSGLTSAARVFRAASRLRRNRKSALPGSFYGPTKAESYDPAFHLINFTAAAAAAAGVTVHLTRSLSKIGEIVRFYVRARSRSRDENRGFRSRVIEPASRQAFRSEII